MLPRKASVIIITRKSASNMIGKKPTGVKVNDKRAAMPGVYNKSMIEK